MTLRTFSFSGITQTLRVWYRASRPFTLSAAIVPVLAGTGLAFSVGHANFLLFVLTLLASLLVQVTTNLIDEYSDHARPEGKRKLLAPYKVIALGLLSSRSVKTGAIICFTIAALIGLYLTSVAGWPILVICLVSAAAAYFYSAGPRPLGNLALGHPLVFLLMGPAMVSGTYYVQTRSFTPETLLLSLSVGFTVTAILVANDLRDRDEDRASGKITLVTLFGRQFGRWEWLALLVAAYLIMIAMVITREISVLALLCLLALPQGVNSLRKIWRGNKRSELTLALRASSLFHLLFGLFIAAGLVIGHFIIL